MGNKFICLYERILSFPSPNNITIDLSSSLSILYLINEYKDTQMKTWTKPQATEMRFGFEITMYVMNK